MGVKTMALTIQKTNSLLCELVNLFDNTVSKFNTNYLYSHFHFYNLFCDISRLSKSVNMGTRNAKIVDPVKQIITYLVLSKHHM